MNWKHYNKITRFFRKLFRIRVSSKFIRREIYAYLRANEWKYTYTIFQIKVYLTFKGIQVVVHTSWPGVFIGKAGHFITGVEQHLQKYFRILKVRCTVEEPTVWKNLHK